MRDRSRGRGWNRREWLASGLATAGMARIGMGDDGAGVEAEDIAAVEDQAGKAGLGPVRVGRSKSYLGLGTAPPDFRAEALEIVEGLADDYLAHFKARGFEVARPPRRMTLVMLADHGQFEAFLGEKVPADLGGIYHTGTNRLVIFDFRAADNGNARRINTVSLFHEATHQLTFNTGLLDRRGDLPACIAEGLGMYGEVRRPNGVVKIGAVNLERVQVIEQARRAGRKPFPSKDLLTDDALLDRAETEQLAYAQSWLLIYHLMKSPRRLPQFRAYLDVIRHREDDKGRLKDALDHFGTLEVLDREMLGRLARLPRR